MWCVLAYSCLWNCYPISHIQTVSPSMDMEILGSKFPFDWNSSCKHTVQSIDFPPWWRHQMETFSALLAICGGNSPVTGEFPAQRPVSRSFDIFFVMRLNKRLSNNGEAGDLRRYGAHYDVAVMPVYGDEDVWQDFLSYWNTGHIL